MAEQHHAAGEYRVQFDFEIGFSNGGGIQGQEFRLDIDGDDIPDAELADAIIRDLRLLMVSEVRIVNKQIIREPHKRSRTARQASGADGRTRIDLSHVVEDGMVTYPGLPAPVIRDFLRHPFLTAAAARHLAAEGAALVGIDSLNIDDTSSGERPVHTVLLASGIPICEHLTNLTALPAEGIRFTAVPVKIRGMGTFPVRAYATIQG